MMNIKAALLVLKLLGPEALESMGVTSPEDATDEDRARCERCEWMAIEHEGHCHIFVEIMPACAQYRGPDDDGS